MIMANVYWRGAMLVLLLVLIPLLAGGCATTSEPPTTEQLQFRAEAIGYATVWAAIRFGDVNTLELRAALPIVQDVRRILATNTEDRPVVIADLLLERLDLAEHLDPVDVSFVRGAIKGMLAKSAARGLDPKAEQVVVVVEAYLKGVETAILAVVNSPT